MPFGSIGKAIGGAAKSVAGGISKISGGGTNFLGPLLGVAEAASGGSLLGAGLGALGDVASAYQGYTVDKEAQQRAHDFNKEILKKKQDFDKAMYQRRYGMTMHSMKKAGLNPMLAYQQGASGQPIGGVAGGTAPSGTSATQLASNVSAKTQRALAKVQRNQIDLIQGQARHAHASAKRQGQDYWTSVEDEHLKRAQRLLSTEQKNVAMLQAKQIQQMINTGKGQEALGQNLARLMRQPWFQNIVTTGEAINRSGGTDLLRSLPGIGRSKSTGTAESRRYGPRSEGYSTKDSSSWRFN